MTIYGFSIWLILGVLFTLALAGLVFWLLSIVYRQTKLENQRKRRAAPVMDREKIQKAQEEQNRIAKAQAPTIEEQATNARFFGEEDDIFSSSPFRSGESPLFGVQASNETEQQVRTPTFMSEDTGPFDDEPGPFSPQETFPHVEEEPVEDEAPRMKRPVMAPSPNPVFEDIWGREDWEEEEPEVTKETSFPTRKSMRNNIRNT